MSSLFTHSDRESVDKDHSLKRVQANTDGAHPSGPAVACCSQAESMLAAVHNTAVAWMFHSLTCCSSACYRPAPLLPLPACHDTTAALLNDSIPWTPSWPDLRTGLLQFQVSQSLEIVAVLLCLLGPQAVDFRFKIARGVLPESINRC